MHAIALTLAEHVPHGDIDLSLRGIVRIMLHLIVAAVIFGGAWYIVDWINPSAPIKKGIQIVILILGFLCLIAILLSLINGDPLW